MRQLHFLPRGAILFVSLLVAVAFIPSAFASDGVTIGASSPALRVDSKGNADVTWVTGGAHESFVVPKTGAGFHGALATADVSKPAALALPMAVVVRKTPDGTLWALQQIDVSGRPAFLDLSRWRGQPTQLTLATDGKRVTGGVMFNGHPVTGESTTATGKQFRIYVYIECFGCPGNPGGWSFMLGVPPKADGTFAVALRPSWVGTRYRATVSGPNVDGELAPDAQTVIAAA